MIIGIDRFAKPPQSDGQGVDPPARTGCSRGITPQGFILFLSPVPDRQLQNQHFKIAIMGQAERPTCPGCGAFLILALPPGGKGPRKLQCLDCDRPDPLKSEYVTGWLEGELQPPTKGRD
jgi:hypothetical protein